MNLVRTARHNTSLLQDPKQVFEAAAIADALPCATGPIGGAAWIRAWWEVYGRSSRLSAALARDGDDLTGFLPLVRVRPWVAETLSVRDIGEPLDVRGEQPEAMDALAQELLRRRIPLRLRRLPSGSPLIPHVVRRRSFGTLILRRRTPGTPTITLDDGWRQPERHFSARRRADFRAGHNRAARLGKVEYSWHEPTEQEVPGLLEEFMEVEAAGWKTRAGTALRSQAGWSEFYLRLLTLAAAEGTARFLTLRVNSRAIAGQIALETEGRYSLLKIGFDEQYARCSPGNLLMLFAVRECANRDLRSFEFLGQEEPWISVWTDDVRPCETLHVYPPNLRSLVAAGGVAIVLTKRTFRGLRRRVAARYAGRFEPAR